VDDPGGAVSLVRGARPRPGFIAVAQTELCIDQSSGCGSNVVHGGGVIDATSKEQATGHVPVVAGTAAPSVARVVVRTEIDGRLRRHPTALVTVRDPKLLRAIGVLRPFGRYIAEVPAGTRGATAEARGARGCTLGLAFFPGFRGPVGEGRACYSRPRVVRLRLLDPARVTQKSRSGSSRPTRAVTSAP
jgi:hypothetical protein